MDYALREYTLAYQALLDWGKDHESLLKQEGQFRGKFNGKAIASLLPRIEAAIHSSLRDSLLLDVAGNLASYFALQDVAENTGYPVARDPAPEAYQDALEHFVRVGADEQDYNYSRDLLLARARGEVMPLYFCRPDGATRNRNFSLLVDAEKRQLLAALWLLPQGHSLCRPIGARRGNLRRIDTGEVFKSNSETAILVPLEVGRNGWQEMKFLQPSAEGFASVQSAFLVRRDGEYFLHVSFEFPCPALYEPDAWLGVDQGILKTAAYGLVDRQGKVLGTGHVDDDLRQFQIENGRLRRRMAQRGKGLSRRHWKQQEIEHRLHQLANTLIALALQHRAGISIEDLNPAFQVRGSMVVSRFRKLDRILDYKCKLAGVPLRRVFAAYSSKICHRCGEEVRRSEDRQTVWCDHCGYQGHADENAAVNIGRRSLYKKAEWPDYRAFHRSFRV